MSFEFSDVGVNVASDIGVSVMINIMNVGRASEFFGCSIVEFDFVTVGTSA